MNTPAEQREKKIKAAEKARSLIEGLGRVHDLDARATMLHDRVSEGIRTICTQNQGFNQKQTEVLTEIAVHLALLFDSDMKAPAGFLRKLRVEVGRLGPVGKITFVGVAVTLLIGVAQIAHFGWTYAEGYITPPTEAEELEQITSIPGVATSSEAPAANSPSEHDSPDAQAKR